MTSIKDRIFTPDELAAFANTESQASPEAKTSPSVQLPKAYRQVKGGNIEYLTLKTDKDGTPIEQWDFLCSALEILARTQDSTSKNNGLLIKIKAPSGHWHEIALPAELWVNDGKQLREILAHHGLKISNSLKAKHALLNLFSFAAPKQAALCVERIGWHGKTFVFPDQAIGKEDIGRVVYQSATPEKHPFNCSGTLQGWKDHIAAYAAGNSRLVGAISMSFASPLLYLVHEESGGFNYFGQSSRGKTTALEVAGSVWGGGNISGYIKSWRATDNGLEGVAASRCDALLPLDELGQVTPWAVSNAVYMLGNGQGKVRASKTGQAREPAQWRLLFLSSGEIPLVSKIEQAKGNNKVMAGQKVRFLDIPMDGGAGFGLFEDCHGLAPARFALMFKDAVKHYYGTAARAFLEKITAQDWATVQGQIKALQSAFIEEHARTMDGLVQRAAGRFALVAAAGELATRWHITGWQEGEATRAAQRLFKDWLVHHGSPTVATETIDGIKQVKSFLEQHGASRFTHWDMAATDKTQNRCGFVKYGDDGTTFYIFTHAWKTDVCRGFDSQSLAKILAAQGILTQDGGKNAKVVRLPDKTTKRVYVLDVTALENQSVF